MFDEGFCAEPLCYVDDASRPTPFYRAAKADGPYDPKRCYLVEVQGYIIGATTGLGVRARPMGFDPISSIPDVSAGSVGLTMLRYSDAGYTSKPTGALPSQLFDGRTSQALRLNLALPIAPENSDRIVLTTATVEIINTDGVMDNTFDQLDLSGRLLTIKYGLVDYPYEKFTTIFPGAIDTAARDLSTFTLTARDRGYRLAVRLQNSLYAGSGGIEGTADLANRPRPIAFGKLRNISPVQFDPANLAYQFHFREAQAVDAVYDRGAALTFTADYATYALLIAAVLSAGEYATCLALGLIRVGATPSGTLTADVQGDAHGGYIDTTADIVKRVLTDFALITESEISAAGFSAFNSDVPGVIGWYETEASTCEEAVNMLAGHCAGWLTTTRDGLFTIQRLGVPETGVIIHAFRSYEIDDVEILTPPDGTIPPRFRQTVSWRRNWTVQTGQDVADLVDDARRLTISQPYNIAAAVRSQTEEDFLLAQDAPVLESLFYNEADALEVAQRQIDLLGTQRKTVRVHLDTRGHLPIPGASVSIDHPRINNGNPLTGIVIGQEIDANARECDIILWG